MPTIEGTGRASRAPFGTDVFFCRYTTGAKAACQAGDGQPVQGVRPSALSVTAGRRPGRQPLAGRGRQPVGTLSCSRKPPGNVSRGSRISVARPIAHARPVISGTMAGLPPPVVRGGVGRAKRGGGGG